MLCFALLSLVCVFCFAESDVCLFRSVRCVFCFVQSLGVPILMYDPSSCHHASAGKSATLRPEEQYKSLCVVGSAGKGDVNGDEDIMITAVETEMKRL